MRVLAITKLFPNRLQPFAGAFNRQQFAALGRRCELEVIATVPWFPGARAFAKWSEAGRLVGVPRRDQIEGLEVSHPRLLYVPKLHSLAGALCLGSLLPDAMRRRGTVDVVLGSWAYPHGVAAAALAGLIGAPVAIKLHGSDINRIAELPGPRRHVSWALSRAARVIAVSGPLANRAIELGASPSRVEVVRNGVDSELFFPRDRAAARRKLGRAAGERMVLYVGWLVRTKGPLDLVEAFAGVRRAVPDATLVVVGDGAARGEAEARAAAIGNVTFTGALPLEDIATWMAACDTLALPSWAEGTPNVVLEALASGRRVVASKVGGIPDLVTSETLGRLVPPRDIPALEAALIEVVRQPYDAAEVAAAGSPGSWEDSAEALYRALERAAQQ